VPTTTVAELNVAIPNAVEHAEPRPTEPMTPEVREPVDEPRASLPTEQTGQKVWAPRGPHWFENELLSASNDGPRMRLGRDNRYRQMVIAFDESPCDEVLERLHQGWTWRQAEGQWTKQLEIGHEQRGHQDAEKLFEELLKLELRDRNISQVTEAIRR
jgi:hypothetical protein